MPGLWAEPQSWRLVSSCPQSFFDGWDCTKKKDKTKGRHDTLLGCECSGPALPRPFQPRPLPTALFSSRVSDDRHRVKLHPLLGDPNSDYINANYIDVSAFPLPGRLSHASRSADVHPILLSSVRWPASTWSLPSNQRAEAVVSGNPRGITAFKARRRR